MIGNKNGLSELKQVRVAAGGGCILRVGFFGGKSEQVMGAAGLGARARQSLATKRLNPDDRADQIAVDVLNTIILDSLPPPIRRGFR